MENRPKQGGHVVAVDAGRYRTDGLPQERAAWEAAGHTLAIAAAVSEDEIIAAAQDADVVTYMGLYAPFTARVLAALPRCKLVARYGIGVDTVDIDAATELGIMVCNAAEFCVPEVADHAAALILSLARRVTYLDRQIRAGHWSETLAASGPLRRFNRMTVGMVGFGRIGRRLAEIMRPMAGRLLAYDPYVTPEAAALLGVEMMPLPQLLAESDFVSVHTPLMASTRGLIGAEQLALMQPSAYLVNTSRGPVVDEQALIEALQARRIAGAALDVFDPEPLAQDSPLRALENVILTPHVAANSAEAIEDLTHMVIQTVLDALSGQRPKYLMNSTVKPRS